MKEVLGKDSVWANANALGEARRLWRHLADEYNANGTGGHRWTERVVGCFFACARWLRGEDAIPADACVAPPGWQAKLMEEWEERTNTAITVNRPRHTAEEMRRIFAALDDERVDPRMALIIEFGAERRAGQVRRCKRSDLDLTPTADSPHGKLRVRGSRRKPGATVYLTPEQSARVRQVLESGYLSGLEERYQRGEITDYCIFPQGILTSEGKARRRCAEKHVDRRTVLGWFHELEEAADVDHQPRRGWYGLRRQAADLMEDEIADDRVLNAEGGWKDSDTRRKYQQEERPEVLRRAAEARRRIRGGLGSDSHVDQILAMLKSGDLPPEVVGQIESLLTSVAAGEGTGESSDDQDV